MLFRSLKGIWEGTFGAIFDSIGGIAIGRWPARVHPFGFLKDLSHRVENSLGAAADGYEATMGFFWHQTARLQVWVAEETLGMARDTLHFGEWLVHTYVPNAIHDAVGSLRGPVTTIVRKVGKLELTAAMVARIARIVARDIGAVAVPRVAIPHVGEWQWIHRHWKALTAAVAAAGGLVMAPGLAIPRLWHGIDELKHRLGRIEHRLTKVEALFGATALAAAMANVLGLKSWRCLRGGPISKVARKLCGLSGTALNDLLGLLVDVVIFTDICKVIELLNEGLSIIEGPIESFVGVVEGGLCHGDFDAPPTLSVASLSLPPVTGLSLSLG